MGESIEEIRANLRRTVTALSDARILTWYNWSQRYLADMHTYEEMQVITSTTTTSAVSLYNFPTRMKDIYTLVLSDSANSCKLVYVNAREFDTKVPSPSSSTTGRPGWYVDYGTQYQLFRIPDSSYTIVTRYTEFPADLVISDTSQSTTLSRKDALLCGMSTVFGFYALRELEDASYWSGNMVTPLYKASLETDHRDIDWVPVARQYIAQEDVSGQVWKNPLVGGKW